MNAQTKWRRRAARLAACVCLFGCWAIWYRRYGSAPLSQALNPLYWWNRHYHRDLYRPDQRILLHGNYDLPEVALTFDDGPHPESRAAILDILKANHIHATFFDVGLRMAQNPDLLRRTLNEGHIVGNHTFNHFRLIYQPAKALHREINDTDITFYRITGRHLSLLRPPGMRYDARVLRETNALGYTVVGYSAQSNDFNRDAASEYIINRAQQRTDAGGILLLHDYIDTARALPGIVAKLRADGFRFVTIPEMLAHLPAAYRPSQAAINDTLQGPSLFPATNASANRLGNDIALGTYARKVSVSELGGG